MNRIYPLNAGSNNMIGVVGVPEVDEENDSTKISDDRYEVFVNDDKVGNKILLTQTDDPKDLNKFLKDNGFNNFKTNVLGDHIVIETNERPQKMKEILSSYLDIR